MWSREAMQIVRENYQILTDIQLSQMLEDRLGVKKSRHTIRQFRQKRGFFAPNKHICYKTNYKVILNELHKQP